MDVEESSGLHKQIGDLLELIRDHYCCVHARAFSGFYYDRTVPPSGQYRKFTRLTALDSFYAHVNELIGVLGESLGPGNSVRVSCFDVSDDDGPFPAKPQYVDLLRSDGDFKRYLPDSGGYYDGIKEYVDFFTSEE